MTNLSFIYFFTMHYYNSDGNLLSLKYCFQNFFQKKKKKNLQQRPPCISSISYIKSPAIFHTMFIQNEYKVTCVVTCVYAIAWITGNKKIYFVELNFTRFNFRIGLTSLCTCTDMKVC